RAAQMLKEDMEFMGPVRRRVIEEAQGKVVAVVRRLEDTGKITIQRGGQGTDDELVGERTLSADNPRIIARATPVGTRRLRALPAAEAVAAPADVRGRIAPPPGGEARTLTGLNGFLESARRQGAELIAVAREQAEAIAQNAREQGFAAGYADGIAQAEKAASDLVSHAERTAREVTEYRAQAIADSERELVELALGLAEKILQRTFQAE